MLIGIDDTDSLSGMCTTYLAMKLSHELTLSGMPKLVRLNPNIPFKTRGNGAIALKTNSNSDQVKKIVIDLVKEFSHTDDKRTNPGVVFVGESRSNQNILTSFYQRVVSQLVSIREAEEISKKVNADTFRLNNGRGIIGALASLGFVSEKKTFELIAYRTPENYGKKRMIDNNSVFMMNKMFYPNVFDSIDEEKNQILITPRGSDPVFCGIRGKSQDYVKEAWSIVRPIEEIDSTLVFETNQATDDHLRDKSISKIQPYDCLRLEGKLSSPPRTIEGGHVVFKLVDSTGDIDCAAYQPTGGFRTAVRSLNQGDAIVVCGGVGKYANTVNMEKMYVKEMVNLKSEVVPVCCLKNMTSAGRNKGFKCKKCGKKVSQKEVKTAYVQRFIKNGWYEVPPRARRHLSKPLILE